MLEPVSVLFFFMPCNPIGLNFTANLVICMAIKDVFTSKSMVGHIHMHFTSNWPKDLRTIDKWTRRKSD